VGDEGFMQLHGIVRLYAEFCRDAWDMRVNAVVAESVAFVFGWLEQVFVLGFAIDVNDAPSDSGEQHYLSSKAVVSFKLGDFWLLKGGSASDLVEPDE
jgi:hypothetical protein